MIPMIRLFLIGFIMISKIIDYCPMSIITCWWLGKMMSFLHPMELIGRLFLICPKMHTPKGLYPLESKPFINLTSWKIHKTGKFSLLLERTSLFSFNSSLSLLRFGVTSRDLLNHFKRASWLLETLHNVSWMKKDKLWKVTVLTWNLSKYISNIMKLSLKLHQLLW